MASSFDYILGGTLTEQPHQALNYQTPAEVYGGAVVKNGSLQPTCQTVVEAP
jgi:hypothetical protein